jgi:tight adherence protein C
MDIAQIELILTIVSAVLITAGVGGAGMIFVRNAAAASRRRARLAGDTIVSSGGGGGGAPAAFNEVMRGVKRIGDRIAIQDPSQVTQLKAKLIQAGFYSREAITLYLGARTIAMILATLATIAILPWAISGGGGMFAVCTAAVFGFAAIMGPDQVLKVRRSARELEYREGFPDLLDLLVASVEAGLSLDAAVSRVTDELRRRYPNLAEHLSVLNLELRAGRARKDAWTGLADRLGIDEAASLATMLRQAEEMGTSLGETLAVFSDDMRAKRMLRAEEKAMALPAKMMIPLILFIFPCLMGVLILPAAFNISRTLGGG